jgi:DNA polymerase-4
MRVMDGRDLCPKLIILPSDPPKYRFVNRALLKLFNEYSPRVSVRSIDEMLLNFEHLTNSTIPLPVSKFGQKKSSLLDIARDIKERIKSEIGDWLTASVGISTNPYLAKLAAGLHKPDGLDEIGVYNVLHILSTMKLTDLPYIKERNALRLNLVGIHTPVDFYFAHPQRLKAAFESIQGHYWYLRLHGHDVDTIEWQRHSIGHQYALPKRTAQPTDIEPLLCKLVEKVGRRLRSNNLTAQGVHLALGYDAAYWHKGHKFLQPMYTNRDLFDASKQLLQQALPLQPVRQLAITCFALTQNLYTQTTLFQDELKKRALTRALDQINDRWGEFSVIPGTMIGIHREGKILDRIAFGRVVDIPEIVLKEQSYWQREVYEY